jgi:hypothetical protein
MLEQILKYFSGDLSDDDYMDRTASLESFQFEDDGMTLTVSLSDLSQEDTQLWKVTLIGLREFLVRRSWGEVEVSADHVLSRQFNDQRFGMSFLGKPSSKWELIGQLYSVHRKLVGDFLPLEKYLTNLQAIEFPIGRGFGHLGDGPEFLMTAYAEVLKANGVEPNLYQPFDKKWFDGLKPRDSNPQLSTMILGGSYWVAEKFEETRLS